jgi:glycine cleavage system H protein
LSGSVISANEALKDHPEYINDDPYDKGWMVRIKLTDATQLNALLDAESYLNYLQGR